MAILPEFRMWQDSDDDQRKDALHFIQTLQSSQKE